MPTIDRNARTRLIFHAEALDRRTHLPRQHGGMLKRTGLAVFKALLFQFQNVATGRCDPSYDAIAFVAGVARSTVGEALKRLEAAGLITRHGRRLHGPWGSRRISNAYAFPLPPGPEGPASGNRPPTTTQKTKPQSARSVPETRPAWMTEGTREEAREYLRRAQEVFRRQRLQQEAQAGRL